MAMKYWPRRPHKYNKYRTIDDKTVIWELLLRKLNVTEDEAVQSILTDMPSSVALRKWVLKNYARYFVPEKVLSKLNIDISIHDLNLYDDKKIKRHQYLEEREKYA